MSRRGRPRTTMYPHLGSTGKVKEFFERMKHRAVPRIVDQRYLIQNDFVTPTEYTSMARILTDLQLIDSSSIPTSNYSKYVEYSQDANRRKFLQTLVKRMYEDLFNLHSDAWRRETSVLQTYFERSHQSGSVGAAAIRLMVSTFHCLCELCEFHEDSPEIVKIVRSIDSITSIISPQQQDQFLQALACVGHEANRASIVLAWTVVADYLREYLQSDNFAQLQSLGRKNYGRSNVDWSSVIDLDDLLENYSDFQIIAAISETYKIKTNSRIGVLHNRLDTLRKRRNASAHPSAQNPNQVESLSFISECVKAIYILKQKKNNQFP